MRNMSDEPARDVSASRYQDNRPEQWAVRLQPSDLKSLFWRWELASVETGEDLSKDFVRGESWLLSGLSLLAQRKLYIQIKCRFEGNKRWRYQVTQTSPEFYYSWELTVSVSPDFPHLIIWCHLRIWNEFEKIPFLNRSWIYIRHLTDWLAESLHFCFLIKFCWAWEPAVARDWFSQLNDALNKWNFLTVRT